MFELKIKKVVVILLVFYLAFLITIYFLQERMLYFPEREIWQTPKDIGLDYEDIYMQTKDNVTVSGWYIPAENEKGVLLFFHGNAGNISHRLESISIFHSLGLSVLIFVSITEAMEKVKENHLRRRHTLMLRQHGIIL